MDEFLFPEVRACDSPFPPDFLYLNNPNPKVGVNWGSQQDSLYNPRSNHYRLPRKPEGRWLPSWSFA